MLCPARSALCGLLAASALIALAGCGHSHVPRAQSPSTKRIRLESQDLEAVVRGLQASASSTERASTAAKEAWPYIYTGLPGRLSSEALRSVLAAAADSERVILPVLFHEKASQVLTGPGAELTGLLRDYLALGQRSWEQLVETIRLQSSGPAQAAEFARANVDLYIEGIYDAQFELAQIGKQLEAAYRDLGGPTEFLGPLDQARVSRLAESYSETSGRLYPHVVAKLGS